TEDGVLLPDVLAYLGASEIRLPLLADGKPVPCADVAQAGAIGLVGVAGPDGLDATTITGDPRVDDWPDQVFVYGTLQPTGTAWHIAAPWSVGEPRKAELTGTLYGTGLGWPALHLTGTDTVPGYLVRLRSPAEAFAVLDEYEDSDYRRVRTALVDAGAVVFGHDHAGHGRSDGERALIADFEPVVDDERLVVRYAKDEFPSLPTVLIGHSMGGMIAARYAQRFPQDLTALVLSG